MKIDYVKDGNVISIAAARTDLKFPAVSQAEAYWHGLCDGRIVPNRSDVNPRGISNILSHAFILEKIAPGMAKIRLAGQAISDILGMEMRGMPITALFAPEARHDLQNALEQLFDSPATVQASLVSEGGFTRKRLEAQMFLAPLRDDQGRVTRALGTLQLRTEIDRAPRRFKLHNLNITERVRDEALPPRRTYPLENTGTVEAAYRQIPGFAEHGQGQDLRQDLRNSAGDASKSDKKAPYRPHLRLVDAD
ncbi:PAS domain-containing protein [Aliiroseovarius crassostreae]|uniref:PAS domain-containing protein n=1 Tax=Aliiroseovarius crassostreae TaxID=154981 RepID=UPI003C7D3F2D